jgi:hypothetical protein
MSTNAKKWKTICEDCFIVKTIVNNKNGLGDAHPTQFVKTCIYRWRHLWNKT